MRLSKHVLGAAAAVVSLATLSGASFADAVGHGAHEHHHQGLAPQQPGL